MAVSAYDNAFSQDFSQTANGVKASVNGISIDITFFDPSTVRVVKFPQGQAFTKASLSVTAQPGQVNLQVRRTDGFVSLKSSQLVAKLDLHTGAISFQSDKGLPLLTEKKDGATFKPFNDAGSQTLSVGQAFVLDKSEPIYGLGQHQRGNLNQRNQRYNNMIQGNTDDVVPFFQSIKGYGLFWDNYSPTTFADTELETSFESTVGEGIDYYFMYGKDADGVIAGMRKLTGQAPMFPLWTFGYWQSKERYKTQDEIVGVVKKYRDLGVPLDGIIQDWQYWGNNYLWNAMDFLNVDYVNPKKMIDDIHSLHAHLMISIWASFGPHTLPYAELKQNNMLMDFITWPESGSEKWPPNLAYPSGVRVYDAYNPKARDIYWKYLNKGLFSLGMDGWWMDSTEPDHLEFKPADLDEKTYLGSFRKVRNAFPLMTVGGVSEHQQAESKDKRVFILTRSAFAGQQRYGANTWSGDITSSWETLKHQVPTGLNFSLSGIPYWNSDIGGFFLGKFGRLKLADPEYRELYTRWLEFGAFCPMMRSHGTDAPREIYNFGQKGEPVYDAIARFLNLRYRLLPYTYAASHNVTAHQSSMMRALMMDFPADKNVWDDTEAYMFGKSILVRPVTEPMYVAASTTFSPVRTVETYLPGGATWYDFWTGAKMEGGKKVSTPAPIDQIPLFIKAGSVIPWGPQVQYAGEKPWDNLQIRIYPGADADFTLYEDEGDNYNYEKGQCSEIRFHWDDKKRKLTVGGREGSFNGMMKDRVFNIIVAPAGIDGGNKSGHTVRYSGETVDLKL